MHDILQRRSFADLYSGRTVRLNRCVLPSALPARAHPNKAILFENLAPLLSDTGVLFGSTILGAEVDHKRLGRQLMRIYNGKGVFDNEDDRFEDLKAILTRQFQNVRMEQQGVVALFSASVLRK
jgi:hypothetical protein